MSAAVRMPTRILYTFTTKLATFELELIEHPRLDLWASLTMRLTGTMREVAIFSGEVFEVEKASWPERAAIVLSYLCARPGDKSLPKDYFDKYTKEQLAFCAKHARPLALLALAELGELS